VIVFRDATAEERRRIVRPQWINRVAPRRDGKDEGPHGVAFGRREFGVSRALATRMVELVVDDLLARDGVVVTVAALRSDAVEGEAIVGWSAHEPGVCVHFVCVPNGFGRAKIGASLLRRAGADLPASWSTPNGRALERHVRECEAAQ